MLENSPQWVQSFFQNPRVKYAVKTLEAGSIIQISGTSHLSDFVWLGWVGLGWVGLGWVGFFEMGLGWT